MSLTICLPRILGSHSLSLSLSLSLPLHPPTTHQTIHPPTQHHPPPRPPTTPPTTHPPDHPPPPDHPRLLAAFHPPYVRPPCPAPSGTCRRAAPGPGERKRRPHAAACHAVPCARGRRVLQEPQFGGAEKKEPSQKPRLSACLPFFLCFCGVFGPKLFYGTNCLTRRGKDFAEKPIDM